MTREEATEILQGAIKKPNTKDGYLGQAIDMAIQLLSAEPCEDCISRQAANILVDELARAISDERCFMPRGRSTASIMQDILDLPSVKPKTDWISVRERLPEMYVDVLMCSKDGWIEVAHRWGTGDEFIDSKGTSWGINEGNDYDVLAWMPLPEPYQTESEVEK